MYMYPGIVFKQLYVRILICLTRRSFKRDILPVKFLKVVILKTSGGAARTSKLYGKKVYNK